MTLYIFVSCLHLLKDYTIQECSFAWWLLLGTLTWHHLYCVFTYISFLIDKDHCESWNVSIKLLCALLVYFLPFIWRLLHFFDKIFFFLSNYWDIHSSIGLLSFSTRSLYFILVSVQGTQKFPLQSFRTCCAKLSWYECSAAWATMY